MSALDQAFIKAYASAKPASVPPAATSQDGAVETARQPRESMQTNVTPAPTSAPRLGDPMMDQLYAEGALYRLDAAATSKSAVPAPHLPSTTLGARRSARRFAQRAAVQAAAITEPQAAAAASDVEAPESYAPPARPQRRLWTRNVIEIARRLASGGIFDEECELSPEIVVQDPPKPSEPAHEPARPVDWPPQSPLNVVVQPVWDPQAAPWPSTEVTLCPETPDWLAGTIAANVAVDLEAIPEPSASKQEKKFRVDAAHSAPKPHKPAKKIEKQVVEQVLASEPEAEPMAESPIAESTLEPAAEHSVEVVAEAVAEAVPEPSEVAPAAEQTVAVPESKAAEVVAAAPAPTTAAEPTPVQAETPAPEMPAAQTTSVSEQPPSPAAAEPATPPVASSLKKPCVPVWEVDRFLWPVTCEKLLQDEAYFAESGEKLLSATRDGLKSLAITGSRRGEGRSTIALSLARSAAKTGLSVAVVDADFARPQLAEMIGLEVSYSWADAALGKIPLSEAAIKSLEDRITVLPLEASAAGSSLSLADPRVTATLRALNATFDLVILDLGPLSPGNEPLFPAGEACPVDAAVVVRDLRYASLSETKAIGQRLQAAGLEAVGIAENFVCQEAAAAAA